MRGAVGVRGAKLPALGQVLAVTFPTAALTKVPVGNRPLIPDADSTDANRIDDIKTGTRCFLKFGASDYRCWYEAITSKSTANYTGVAYATGTDGLAWAKQGYVLQAPAQGTSWEWFDSNAELAPDTVMYDLGPSVIGGVAAAGQPLFRMWYHGGGNAGSQRGLGYAESPNGTAWTRYGNRILTTGTTGAWDEKRVVASRTFRMPDGTYRHYYAGSTPAQAGFTLGLATSPDGVTLTKYPGNPLFANSFNGNFGIIRHHGMWVAWYSSSSASNGDMTLMVSLDGLHWSFGATVLNGTGGATDPDAQIGDAILAWRDGDHYNINYGSSNTGGSYPGNTQARTDAIGEAQITDPMNAPYAPSLKLVQAGPMVTGTGASITATLPTGATAGSKLVVVHYQQNGTAATIPTGWTRGRQTAPPGVSNASPAVIVTLFFMTALASGGENSLTITAGGSSYQEAIMFEIAGLTSATNDGTSGDLGTGTLVTSHAVPVPSANTVTTEAHFVAMGLDAGSGGFSQWDPIGAQAFASFCGVDARGLPRVDTHLCVGLALVANAIVSYGPTISWANAAHAGGIGVSLR